MNKLANLFNGLVKFAYNDGYEEGKEMKGKRHIQSFNEHQVTKIDQKFKVKLPTQIMRDSKFWEEDKIYDFKIKEQESCSLINNMQKLCAMCDMDVEIRTDSKVPLVLIDRDDIFFHVLVTIFY